MRYQRFRATILIASAFVSTWAISSLARGTDSPGPDKTGDPQPRQNTESPPKTEFAMRPGMRVEATNKVGTMIVTAVDTYTRSYTWEGATRSDELSPRQDRWYGSLGIFGVGAGDHWKEHNGITRGVLEEGQHHFKTVREALAWLEARAYMDYVYRDDGLVVGWSKTLPRNQLNVEVWQLMIDGKKPTRLTGSRNDKIKVTQVETETSALVKAVKKGDVAAVKALLQKGADPNVKDSVGRPVLVLAVTNENTPIIRALIERKADVNARDEEGLTPLLYARDGSVIAVLLDAGADINIAQSMGVMKGYTPLMRAAMGGDSEVLKLLLKRGAKVDAREQDGMTALIIAAMQGEASCVKILLKSGANINAKTDSGLTALRSAQIVQEEEVIKTLKAAGAKE
jgi:hypothetical protein